MAPPKEFHLFAKLPPELRMAIWRTSILDYTRDRTSESREIAIGLYPIRLPVSRVVSGRNDGVFFIVNEDAEIESEGNPPHGVVHISAKRDIFVFLNRLECNFTNESHYPSIAKSHQLDFCWRSASLSLLQCQSVRSILLFDFLATLLLRNGCRGTPRCAIKRGLMFHNRFHDKEVFSGVRTCLYVSLDSAQTSWVQYWDIMNLPGHRLLKEMEESNMIACFNGEDMKNYQEKERPYECVCTE
ncbi:hypothetical protein F4824DRAFT_501652 [Ustulina deusta]|nr:hypothetical protein F4824DRAFT_501652 [Ustulina deusta]